jgi:predicted exporter
VSLLLVAGIGLDYSLFFSRLGSVAENNETLQALLVCCISTSTVFVMLSASSIPVLHSIGVTVFSGVLAAFSFSWLFSRNTDNLKELSE